MPLITEFQSMGDAPGVGAFQRVLGFEGVDKPGAVPGLFKVNSFGTIPQANLPAGSTTLSLELMRTGILTAANPGLTSLLLPTFATLEYTYDPNNRIAFMWQNVGLGGLFINLVAGVTVYWNDMEPQYLVPFHQPVTLITVGPDTWVAG